MDRVLLEFKIKKNFISSLFLQFFQVHVSEKYEMKESSGINENDLVNNETSSTSSDENKVANGERDTWTSSLDFFMSTLGYAVGIG